MKRLITGLTVVGILALSAGQVRADDDWGWFAAGAAAGVLTGAVLADSAHYHHHYYGCGHGGYYGSYYPRYQHTHYYGCGHYGYTYHRSYSGRHHYHNEVYE